MMDTQTRQLRFELRGCPPNLSNHRLHWAQRHRILREWKRSAFMLGTSARNTEGWNVATAQDRRQVVITLRRSPLLDPDNAYASVKPVVDGLVSAGLIHDDGPVFLELTVRQEKARRRFEQRTIIEVFAMGARSAAAQKCPQYIDDPPSKRRSSTAHAPSCRGLRNMRIEDRVGLENPVHRS